MIKKQTIKIFTRIKKLWSRKMGKYRILSLIWLISIFFMEFFTPLNYGSNRPNLWTILDASIVYLGLILVVIFFFDTIWTVIKSDYDPYQITYGKKS